MCDSRYFPPGLGRVGFDSLVLFLVCSVLRAFSLHLDPQGSFQNLVAYS